MVIVQRTLSRVLRFHGVGLHSGRVARIKLMPVLRPNYGIWLRRTDIPHAVPIRANWRNVVKAPLCTVLGDKDACKSSNERLRVDAGNLLRPSELLDVAIAKRSNTIWTVEHLMAALHAVQIENIDIEVDGCEIPILDGSSALFLQAIAQNVCDVPFYHLHSTSTDQSRADAQAHRSHLLVKQVVRVEGRPGQWAQLSPPPTDAQRELDIELSIDFRSETASIPPSSILSVSPSKQKVGAGMQESTERQAAQQHILVRNAHRVFATELSFARTFCLENQLQALWSQRLARGGSRRNALVFSLRRSNESGTVHLTLEHEQHARFADEMVRHKALDVMGDLLLAGGVLAATYSASQPSHALNLALVESIFKCNSNYDIL